MGNHSHDDNMLKVSFYCVVKELTINVRLWPVFSFNTMYLLKGNSDWPELCYIAELRRAAEVYNVSFLQS